MMAMMTIMIIKKVNTQMIMALMVVSFNLSLNSQVNGKTMYFFSSDLISFWITSMSMMIFYIMFFIKQKKSSLFTLMMAAMIMAITATFNSWNLMMFYVLFEMTMILILLVIIAWGYQPERTEAMMFMIVMTLMFSLPFLAAIMKSSKNLSLWFMETNNSLLTTTSFLLIFMMKMPAYFTHFWLPKVHVEAPVQGSMILAAIMLKLGCYGMMRMNEILMKFKKLKMIIIPVSIISMVILSTNCIIQTDIKTLIAYSSIVHMAMVMISILIMKPKSMFSSLLIILGHGMCSASMFFMASLMYEKSKSRSMLMNKGVMKTTPGMTLMWFTACMNNAPMPPSMNMLGEMMSIKSTLLWSSSTYSAVATAAMMSSMYSIYAFCATTQGPFSKMINKMNSGASKSTTISTIMLIPPVMIMTKPAMMMI